MMSFSEHTFVYDLPEKQEEQLFALCPYQIRDPRYEGAIARLRIRLEREGL